MPSDYIAGRPARFRENIAGHVGRPCRIFFGTTALTLLVLRKRPAPEGYRAPAAPLAVWLFVAASAYVVYGSIRNDAENALIGAGLLFLGVPVFLFWRWRGGLASRTSS